MVEHDEEFEENDFSPEQEMDEGEPDSTEGPPEISGGVEDPPSRVF